MWRVSQDPALPLHRESRNELDDDGRILAWLPTSPRDIGSFTWSPDETTHTLTRYQNNDSYNTTTGYIDPHRTS